MLDPKLENEVISLRELIARSELPPDTYVFAMHFKLPASTKEATRFRIASEYAFRECFRPFAGEIIKRIEEIYRELFNASLADEANPETLVAARYHITRESSDAVSKMANEILAHRAHGTSNMTRN